MPEIDDEEMDATPRQPPGNAPGPQLPRRIPVENAPPSQPPPAPISMPELAKAGVSLARWVLVMIAGFIILALILITVSEWNAQSASNEYSKALVTSLAGRRPPSTKADSLASKDTVAASRMLASARADSVTARALMGHLSEERAASRQFVIQIFQMVLLNVLLPVLTALLGYVFGSTKAGGS